MAKLFAALVLVALVAGIVFIIIGIYPHRIAPAKNPSFVDTIFDSRVVIVAARIALMFAAAYVVVSVVGLVAGRRWLTQLGPFRAAEPIARFDSTAEELERDLQNAAKTIDDLTERLERHAEGLTRARYDIALILDQIDTMEGAAEGD